MRSFLFLAAALTLPLAAPAAEQRFTSGDRRVSLVELFTSEGCSSCPSAEHWLGELRGAPGLWRDFVPVEFHVNYWDRLGWPDRFASAEATQREYAYSTAWHSESVYTPCFVRDGAEWRPTGRPPDATGEKAPGLTLTIGPDGTCRVEFSATKSGNENFEVHVTLLGSGFTSRVTAGENRGETLRHEFVALAMDTQPLAGPDGGTLSAKLNLPRTKITDAPRRALAVWVTRRGELTPLQATGGWLAP